MPLGRDLPENLGEGPSCFPASVYPHSLPLNIEDLERNRDVWALKRPVCKIGCLLSQWNPSKRIKCSGNCHSFSSLVGDILCCASVTVTYYPQSSPAMMQLYPLVFYTNVWEFLEIIRSQLTKRFNLGFVVLLVCFVFSCIRII